MSESSVTELRPKAKDVTTALRSRRYRRKRKAAVTVTARVPSIPLAAVEKPNEIKPSATVAPTPTPEERRDGRGVTACTTVAALALATVSAGFSITGMTAVFVGATLPVIGMGVALEAGKLSAVACLGRRNGASLRAALIVLVAVLMGLNAIGAYGFLAKAHIEHAVAGDITVASRAADIDARLFVQASVVADIDRRLAQIDGAVEKATSKGRTASAMTLAEQQRKSRSDLVTQRTAEAKTLAALQVEKAKADGERRTVEADLGPVRYLARLVGAADDDVMRWFILAVALLLDPAAVLLLLAATSKR